jgi:hypothetical protein
VIWEIFPPIEQDMKENDDDDEVWVLRVAPRHTEEKKKFYGTIRDMVTSSSYQIS